MGAGWHEAGRCGVSGGWVDGVRHVCCPPAQPPGRSRLLCTPQPPHPPTLAPSTISAMLGGVQPLSSHSTVCRLASSARMLSCRSRAGSGGKAQGRLLRWAPARARPRPAALALTQTKPAGARAHPMRRDTTHIAHLLARRPGVDLGLQGGPQLHLSALLSLLRLVARPRLRQLRRGGRAAGVLGPGMPRQRMRCSWRDVSQPRNASQPRSTPCLTAPCDIRAPGASCARASLAAASGAARGAPRARRPRRPHPAAFGECDTLLSAALQAQARLASAAAAGRGSTPSPVPAHHNPQRRASTAHLASRIQLLIPRGVHVWQVCT